MKHTPTHSLALTAIALLAFTGCGAQAIGSVPEPDLSSTTSTVASSSTSAVEETASTEETNYSGGSKAPEGEYRAADEHGPAQNVPKPVAPEGMNVESTEAMLLFINYWNDMRNYALQTGDVEQVSSMVDESFTQEQNFYSALDQMYEHEGWVIGGGRTIHHNENLLVSHGNGQYSLAANFEVKDSIFWLGGEATYNDNSEAINDGVEIKLQYANGKWTVISADVVN